MSAANGMRAVGLLVFVIGAILLALGSTSTGLFIFYGVVTVAGGALAASGRKKQDQR
jgi:hypothetical protein